MQKKGANISLKGYDDIFSTDQSRAEAQQERVQEIPLSELHPFEGHPFRVVDDEDMIKTVESVRDFGVLTPAIVRPDPDGGYEIISGHRRHRASELAGKETMPVIVRDMDDDAAIILMVDANLQRETILPSERAFAYKLKLDAMRHQAGRPSEKNYSQVGNNFGKTSSEEMAEELGTSKNQIFRYIRLTELIPEILDMVDNGQIKFNPAVELSYLAREEQQDFLSAMDYRKSGYSKKFFEEHRDELMLHKAAKQAFDQLDGQKVPSRQALHEEFNRLLVEKKQAYAEYRQVKKEMQEYLIAKQTVEHRARYPAQRL